VNAYYGLFLKDNGRVREMSFLRLEELESAKPGFLNAKTTGTGTSPTQGAGKELVWELLGDTAQPFVEGQFRVFNYNTKIREVATFEFDENKLV
jgi:hypothetical protein